jgi:ribosome biogenesis ATPase
MLANAIAGEVGVPFISIAAPVIVSGMSGESEKKLREVFEEAKLLAPCIVFIDEIDAITPKRETAQREMERRIVAQLLTCMDDCSLEKTDYKPVIVIGATNRPDSIDPALRRAGRFDREITLGVPDEQARSRILMKMCEKLKLDGDISFTELAKLTPGFVGADLNSLMGEAGMVAVTRIFSTLGKPNDDMELDGIEKLEIEKKPMSFAKILENAPNELTESELEPLSICFNDFELAVKKVQPSSKREGFATVPGVSWDDIGALQSVRDELRMAIVEPIKNPEYFHSVGIYSSMGCLLYGPPG